jgi:hydrogenase-1 operon protein HyaE
LEENMPSALVRALHKRHGLPVLDAGTIDAFLEPAAGESEFALLLFTGDPSQRSESDDVAVVMPELITAFKNALRGAVIARGAEDGLKARFGAVVMPSLVVTRRGETLAVIPKIRDWSEYMTRIGACLQPDAPVLKPGAGPKTQIQFTGARTMR